MGRSFRGLFKCISILPILAAVPAMAENVQNIGFIGDYVASISDQLHDILAVQNTKGFEISKITIGNNMNDIGISGSSLVYGIESNSDATQYVKIEQVGLPDGISSMHFNIPLDPYMTDRGLNTNKISWLVGALGSGITLEDFTPGSVELSEDGTTYLPGKLVDDIFYQNGPFVIGEGTLNVEIADFRHMFSDSSIRILLNASMGDSVNFMDVVDALNYVIENGKIEEKYLLTGDNFTVDAQYGNVLNGFIATYRDSLIEKLENFRDSVSGTYQDKVMKGILGLSIANFNNLTHEDIASAVDSYLAEMSTDLSDLGSLKLKIGVIEMNAGNMTVSNGVDLIASNISINGGNVIVRDAGNNIKIDDVNIVYNGQFSNTPMTSTVNYTKGGVYVSGSDTNVTIVNGASLNVSGTELSVTNGATLVNNGTFNINTASATFDEDITGNGTLIVGENTILNVGTKNVTQNVITLNGTMIATLRSGDTAQLNANTFDGTGTLSLAFSESGTYHVFGGNLFGEDGEGNINITSSLYDIDWNGGDLIATLKSESDIVTGNEISSESVATVLSLNQSTSEKLNELGVRIQEKLAEGTKAAKREVEQAISKINPETESVARSIAGAVQNNVTNLASARMAMPSVGRSAGDGGFISGGVWVQGLYNKSKMNDSFDGYTRGIALGADGKINDDITIGAGYAFNHSDVVSNSRDTDIDSNTLFVYGQYKPAEWYINAVLNYTWSEYEEDTTALGTPVTSKYDTGSFGVSVASGYDFDFGITPEVGLRYMYVTDASYTNSLGNTNKFDSTDYLTAMLGAKYGLNIVADEDILFRPELRYAFKYDCMSDESHVTVMMPGTTAYTLSGDRLPRFGNEFGIGLIMKYSMMDLSISYDIEVREDYTSQTGMLKFRYNF